jgi:surface antigen
MAWRPLVNASSVVWVASLVACTSAVTEAPGGFPALDATAQSRRYNAMQQALEKNESGRVLTWEDGNRARGRVVPIATIDTALYGWCREYEERIGTSAANHRLVGIACRMKNGQWLVVDIRSYIERPTPTN